MLLAVFLGGAVGGLARWGLSDWLGAGAGGGDWPWGTLVANTLGAFVLGAVVVHLRAPRPRVHALLGPGLCGALTTFSGLQLEVVRLLRDGHASTALAYLAVTLVTGLAAVRLGAAAVR